MATLTPQRIVELLDPYYPDPTPKLVDQLSLYLDLLLKWNARTNLSAIREPDEMVRRHFGESLFAARHLPHGISTLLDLGSGAGFPGLPIALARPEITVTLAESQNKKSSFLREAVRTLAIPVEVWADRVERMPSERRFDAITLRAVDDPTVALKLARERKTPNGLILEMITAPDPAPLDLRIPATRTGMLRFS